MGQTPAFLLHAIKVHNHSDNHATFKYEKVDISNNLSFIMRDRRAICNSFIVVIIHFDNSMKVHGWDFGEAKLAV